MGAIELELRCPESINGIAADPQPDWSFDNLLLELDSIDKKLKVTLDFPAPFTKKKTRESQASKDNYGPTRGFVMHVSDHEINYADPDSEDEDANSTIVSGRRFACDDLYMSDDSENEDSLGMQCYLMDKEGLPEAALHELTREFQLSVSEEVRAKISAMETYLVKENEKLASLIAKVEKNKVLQEERERKFDLQYHRTTAEALDNHLTAVQRDHEHISQIEERRIRDDAAREEAKRKEKALQEEKLRQERIRAEEEVRLRAERTERARAAAMEAEKQAAEEAAAKKSTETAQAVGDSKETLGPSMGSAFDIKKVVQSSAKSIVKASQNALELEKRRQLIYEEISAKNKALEVSANQDYQKLGRTISRQISTISATVENVRKKSEELVKLLNSPGCPQSICIQLFAEKIVSNCANQRIKSSNAIFATSRVIVLVTSKVPLAMDILIAELNKVCMYTIPKHINYSQEAFESKGAYLKVIGYEEKNGKVENTDDYLERLRSYMKLYGALVQTEIQGFQNLHGLGEGWAWLARFLNALPANLYTAVALDSFLEMAGFALYRRYKNQFVKLLKIVAHQFLNALKESGSASWDNKLNRVKASIAEYIGSKKFQEEPKALQLSYHLESSDYA